MNDSITDCAGQRAADKDKASDLKLSFHRSCNLKTPTSINYKKGPLSHCTVECKDKGVVEDDGSYICV